MLDAKGPASSLFMWPHILGKMFHKRGVYISHFFDQALDDPSYVDACEHLLDDR